MPQASHTMTDVSNKDIFDALELGFESYTYCWYMRRTMTTLLPPAKMATPRFIALLATGILLERISKRKICHAHDDSIRPAFDSQF